MFLVRTPERGLADDRSEPSSTDAADWTNDGFDEVTNESMSGASTGAPASGAQAGRAEASGRSWAMAR